MYEKTLLKKAGDDAPRPDSFTGISYSSKPKVATVATVVIIIDESKTST